MAGDGGKHEADCSTGQEMQNRLFLFPHSPLLQPPQLARRHSRLQSFGVFSGGFQPGSVRKHSSYNCTECMCLSMCLSNNF